jgi:hypothetical protein
MIAKINQENLVPIDLKIWVDGNIIKDQFLWESSNNDCDLMRLFGLQILSEKLGRSEFSDLSQDSKRRLSQSVCEVISYNVNLYNRLEMGSLIGTIPSTPDDLNNEIDDQNTVKTEKLDFFTPIVKINIRLHNDDGELIEDSLFWDLAWNLNKPENFAEEYWNDLGLGKIHQKQISFAIRKQVFDHLKQVSLNKKYNLLKNLGVPVNKEMVKVAAKSMAKKYDYDMGWSEFSDENIHMPK